MKRLEEIPDGELIMEIKKVESVGYLLGMRKGLEERQDMKDGQKRYYALLVERRIGELIL